MSLSLDQMLNTLVVLASSIIETKIFIADECLLFLITGHNSLYNIEEN